MSLRNFIFLFALPFMVGACNLRLGSDESSRVEERSVNPRWVDWSSIPREFNPTIDEIPFNIQGAERIEVNAFDFSRDAEVIYVPTLGKSEGVLRLYIVWSGSAMFGRIAPEWKSNHLKLTQYGQYQCSIRVENRKITQLQGGCYVRLQILLPVGSQIEVVNSGKMLTPRYIPITNSEFFEMLRKEPFAKEKLQVIEEFIGSYNRVQRAAQITTEELRRVLREFLLKEEKFQVLRKLHIFVTDRSNLDRMMDDEFGYFEREEARRIVRGG